MKPALAILVAGAVGMSAAAAGDEGTLRFLRTYVQDYTTIDHAGAQVTGGSLEGVVSIVDASDGPFSPGAHFRVTCIVTLKASEQNFTLEAPCTADDASGDQWYTVSRRDSGDIETGGRGGLELAGGTGVFAGVTGSCTYDVSYLEGGWVAMIADCAWQRQAEGEG